MASRDVLPPGSSPAGRGTTTIHLSLSCRRANSRFYFWLFVLFGLGSPESNIRGAFSNPPRLNAPLSLAATRSNQARLMSEVNSSCVGLAARDSALQIAMVTLNLPYPSEDGGRQSAGTFQSCSSFCLNVSRHGVSEMRFSHSSQAQGHTSHSVVSEGQPGV